MALTNNLRVQLLTQVFSRVAAGAVSPETLAQNLVTKYGAGLDQILTDEATTYKTQLQNQRQALSDQLVTIDAALANL